ncbi:MAG: ABC transporter substrate-binding protein [Chloroflexi bacterium]|nr:ABC transporter substrate-binding protein [Chloroflexota bacterium]
MKLSKFVSILMALTLVVSVLAACGAPTPAPAPQEPAAQEPAATEAPAAEAPAATEPPAKLYIPVISKGFQHQFWQAVKLGSENAAKDFGVEITFEGPESEAMVDKQVEMFQTALDKKPAAICLAAVDSKAFQPLLEKAKAAGIPVIGFDSGVDSDIPVTTATTDNVAAAALAADKMVELIGGEGEVAIIAHDQTSRTGIDRVKGFTDQIANKYADKVTIVDTQYGAGDQLKSTDLAKAIIQAHPNLKGFFGANEGSIIGVLNAVKELGMEGKITVIGYDSGQQQMDAIRAGTEAGAITQNPIGIGYKCVEAAVKAYNGEELPKVIDTGFMWYDATNIDSPEIQAVLYK